MSKCLYYKTLQIRNLQKTATFCSKASVFFIVIHKYTSLDKRTSLLQIL